MRTKVVLSVATILMLVVGVAAIASNMGFKISIPLTFGYANYVSLPYFNSYTDAQSMFDDIPNCVAVKRWNNSTGIYEQYGARGGVNFLITPGEAYIVNVSQDTNWVVVGSHNPSLAVTLTFGYANYVSVPYHTTATNASSLFNQIPNCVAVKRWDNATGIYQQYGARGGTDFSLTPGEGLIINVSSTETWVPTHY